MKNLMKISIIIPNFNGKKLLEENLPKVLNACKGSEVIVVDDASTDGSIAMLSNKFPQVELIHKPFNSGFSSTVNDGVKVASGMLIFILNSDAYIDSFDPASLERFFKDPSVFAVGLLQKSLEDGKIVLRGRGIGTFRRGFLMHERGEINSDTTLWVSAGAGVFRKSIWDKLGGLCPLYNPFYWEDIDLSYRAVKSGYKIYFDTKNSVVHSQKEGSIRSYFTPGQVKTVAYRNQFIFVWLNISDPLYLFNHVLWLSYHIARSFIFCDWAFLVGYVKACKLLLSVILYRAKNRCLWKLSDRRLSVNS